MVFADIEKLKQKYTDKYVIVDAERPELARFRDLVGQVKTVNMSGRALVEFANYNLNIGWFDIGVDFLKVVDKPLPETAKPETKKAHEKAPAAKSPASATPAPAKPTGKSTADILAAARGGGAPAAKPSAAKPSTADILAAARGGAAAPKPSDGKPSTADILAAARAGAKAAPAAPKKDAAEVSRAPAPPTNVDRAKMSVAEMLAAARAGGAAKTGTPSAGQGQPQTAEKSAAAKSAAAPASEPTALVAERETPSSPATSETVDKSKMSVDDMIAWCRQHDTK